MGCSHSCPKPQIAGIFRGVTDHFGSGELAFNDYGRIGWISQLAVRLTRRRCSRTSEAIGAMPVSRMRTIPQTWNPRMTLVEEASLTHEPEVDLFPPWIRIPTRLMGRTKSGARKARILRYGF